MNERSHINREMDFGGVIPLPKHLSTLPTAKILQELTQHIQEAYLARIFDFEAFFSRLQHICRCRPRIYLDFKAGQIRQRRSHSIKLPTKLSTRILEFLFRDRSIGLDDFYLLPRSKRTLGSYSQRDQNGSFSKEKSTLRRFLGDNNLPIQIVDCSGPNACCKLACRGVRSNIDEAQEIVECGQNRMELGDSLGAAALANQALQIDPDCQLAAFLAVRTVRVQKYQSDLYEIIIRAQNYLTRSALRLESSVTLLRSVNGNESLHKTLISKTERRLTTLLPYLRSIWQWHEKTASPAIKPYTWALYLLAQYALGVFGRGVISPDEAFGRLLAIPQISDLLQKFANAACDRSADIVADEVKLRFWRLLAIDAWLPDSLDISGYADALNRALSSRLRFSNSPDGAGKMPSISLYDNLVPETEEQEN